MGIGDVANKNDLLSHLAALRLAAVYNIFALVCLRQFTIEAKAGKADPTFLTATLPEGEVSFANFIVQLANHYGGANAIELTKRNANIAVSRNFFKEAFRITQGYARRTNQIDKFSQQPWHDFALVIASALSHDFKINFRGMDKKRLPVTYKNITLEKEDEGKSSKVTLDILVSLADDIIEFTNKQLK